MRNHSWTMRALAILLVFLLANPVLLEARYKPTSGSVGGVTYEQEIQMGQQAAQQVRQQLPVLPDSSPITQYVQRLGQDLAAHAPGYRWPFNFHVINPFKKFNTVCLVVFLVITDTCLFSFKKMYLGVPAVESQGDWGFWGPCWVVELWAR